MITLPDLYEAYLTSRKHNRRSEDQVEYEMNLYGNLYDLLNSINNRTYKPTRNYTFIHRRPKPREVFAAEVNLKIIQVYIDIRLRPIIENILLPNTFNNRIGKGTLAAVENVINDIFEVSKGYTEDCYIIKFDLKGYFPNMNQDVAYDKIMKILKEYNGEDKDDLAYLIQVTCYCNPQFNCFRKTPIDEWVDIDDYKSLFKKPFGIGGAIGFLFWQVMANLYVNDIVHWIHDNVCPHITQFVDDYVLVTSNKEYVLSMLPEIRRRFQEIGVNVHPKKFYCQHYSKGLEFIGFHIKPGRIHLNNRIINRALHAKFDKRTPNAICQINSYGGLMRIGQNYKVLQQFLHDISRPDIKIDGVVAKGLSKGFLNNPHA